MFDIVKLVYINIKSLKIFLTLAIFSQEIAKNQGQREVSKHHGK